MQQAFSLAEGDLQYQHVVQRRRTFTVKFRSFALVWPLDVQQGGKENDTDSFCQPTNSCWGPDTSFIQGQQNEKPIAGEETNPGAGEKSAVLNSKD